MVHLRERWLEPVIRQKLARWYWSGVLGELYGGAVESRIAFPKDWCETQTIAPKVFNSILNKTPISYKANRMIGGKAPSKYLRQIQSRAQVQVSETEQDDILKSHLIAPKLLREDDFTGFMATRKAALLEVISAAMGKEILPARGDAPAEDEEDEEGEE